VSSSSLFQEIATVPGKIYEWSFDHAARVTSGDKTEGLGLVIGPTINEPSDYAGVTDRWGRTDPNGYNPTTFPYAGAATTADSALKVYHLGGGKDCYMNDIFNAFATQEGKTLNQIIADPNYLYKQLSVEYNGHTYYIYLATTSTDDNWKTYSGVYTVPEGSGTTLFSWSELKYITESWGNILDNVVFESGRPIDSEQSVSFTSGGETQLSAATAAGFAYGIVELDGSTPIPVSGVQAYYDADGQGAAAEAAISADGSGWYISGAFSAQGEIIFKNLTAGKTYRLVGIPAGAINAGLGVNQTPGAVLDEGYYKDTRLVPDGVEDVWNLEAGVVVGDTSAWVAVTNARGDVEYALLDSAEYAQALAHTTGSAEITPARGWTTSGSGRVTFGGLQPGTVYYFVSRPAGYGGYSSAVLAAVPVATPVLAEGRDPALPLVMGGVGSKLSLRFDESRTVFDVAVTPQNSWLGFEQTVAPGSSRLASLTAVIKQDPDTADHRGYIVVITEVAGSVPTAYYYDTIHILQPRKQCVPPKQDNTGSDFFVAFMENTSSSANPTELYLYATTDHAGVTVDVLRSADSSVLRTTSLAQSNVSTIYDAAGYHSALVAGNPAYNGAYQTVSAKSLRVQSSAAISLYAYNAQNTTSESSCILPTAALGDEYFTTSYSGNELLPEEELLVIATEPQTLVTITPADRTFGTTAGVDSKAAGMPFTVYLAEVGQTYVVRSRGLLDSDGKYIRPGLSGTHIKASRPVAVFSGHKCASVGDGCTGSCDHLFEQLLPLGAWGKRYAFAETGLPSNIYRIVAAYDNTQVTITSRDTTETLTLHRGQYASRRQVTSRSAYASIEATQPVQVSLLAESNECFAAPGSNAATGDPFLITLGPVDRGLFSATFSPIKLINTSATHEHYLTVVVEAIYKDSTKLVEVTPGGLTLTVSLVFYDMPNTPYSYGRARVTYQENRNYHLTNPYGFTAYVYGYGYYESYGYLIGAQFGEKLEEQGASGSKLSDISCCVGEFVSLPDCLGGGKTCIDTAGQPEAVKEQRQRQRYYWYNNLSSWGADAPLDSAPAISTATAGVHTFFAGQWGDCGVLYPYQVSVEVVALTEITGFRDTITVCLSTPYTGDYGARPSGGTYTYLKGSNSAVFNHTSTDIPAGYYQVTYAYTDPSTKCTSMATAVIHVETLDRGPILEVVANSSSASYVGDVSLCRGQEVTLRVANARDRTFQWYHQPAGGVRDSIRGDAGMKSTYNVRPSAVAYASGRYSVDVLNTNGCRVTIDTLVTLYDRPGKPHIATFSSTSVCLGSSYTLYDSLEVFQTTDTLYRWYKTGVRPENLIAGAHFYSYTVSQESITGEHRFVLGAVTPVAGKDVYSYGCWSYDTLDMTIHPLANAPIISPGDKLQQVCYGDSLTLTASAISSVGYAYRWHRINPDGSVSELATSLRLRVSAGRYYAQSVSPYGCASTGTSDTVEVAVQDNPGEPLVTVGPTVCKGGVIPLTAVAALPVGATAVYQWYHVGAGGSYTRILGADSARYEVADNGDYSAQATVAYGSLHCSSPYSATQHVALWPQPLAPEVSGATDVCVGEGNVRLAATPRPGSAQVDEYRWYKDGQQLQEFTGDTLLYTQSIGSGQGSSAAAYRVEAINATTGCVSPITAATTVTAYDPQVYIAGAASRDTCFGNTITLQAITDVGSGGAYQWYENGAPLPEKDGTSSHQVRGVDPQQIRVATYSLTVVNKHGCRSTRSNVITTTVYAASNAPQVSVSPPGVCEGDSITLSATRPSTGTYEWFFEQDGQPILLASTSTDSFYTIPAAATSDNGRYSVKITTNDGCVSRDGWGSVEVYSLPKSPEIAPDSRYLCSGDSVRLQAYSTTGQLYDRYRWYLDEGNGPRQLSPTSNLLYTRLAGRYTALGRTEKGCWSPASSVEQLSVYRKPERPTLTPTQDPVSICARSATFLTATSMPATDATSYQWYAQSALGYEPISGETGSQYGVGQSGRYAARAYISYPEAGGLVCPSDSISLPKEVQLFNVPFTPRVEGASTACVGDTIALTAVSESGDPTAVQLYAWYKNNVRLTQEDGATCLVSQIEDARYAVVAISDKGCESEKSTEKMVSIRKPTVEILDGVREVCFGGTVTLEASSNTSAGSRYEWYDVTDPLRPALISGVSSASYVVRGNVGDSTAGRIASYYVYVTDEQGCRSTLPSDKATVSIRELPSTPTVTATMPQCEGATVTLTASPAGAGAYQWLMEKSGAFDPIGVASSESTFQIANIQASQAGRYGVRVTNRWGCTASGGVQVGVYAAPATPLISPSGADFMLCTGDSVALTAYTFNPATGEQYEWEFSNSVTHASLPSSNGRISAGITGTYSVWSRSAYGCRSDGYATASVAIYSRPAEPAITPDGRVSVCANGSTTITGTSSGASSFQWYAVDTATDSYTILSGHTSADYEVGKSGHYAVRADIRHSDRLTCSSISPVKEVELFPLPLPPIVSTVEKTPTGGEKTAGCDGDILTLQASVPNAPTGITYRWYRRSSGEETFREMPASASSTCTVTQVEQAEYRVEAVSDKGCASEPSAAKEVIIRRRPTVSIADVAESDRNPCGGTVTLSALTTPAEGGGEYEWYENDVYIEKAATSSLYVVQGSDDPLLGKTAKCFLYFTDRHGCRSATASNTVQVNIRELPPTPTVAIATATPNGVCEGGDATFTVSPPSAGTYRWFKRSGSAFDSIAYTSDATLRVLNAAMSDAGQYAVEIVNTYGCKSALRGEAELNVLGLPTVRIRETRACEDWTSFDFAEPPGGKFIGWPNDQFIPAEVHQGEAIVTYAYTGPNGCTSRDTKTITIVSLPNTPIITAEGSAAVCEDNLLVSLTANVAVPSGDEEKVRYSYQWYRDGYLLPDEVAVGYVARKVGAYTVRVCNQREDASNAAFKGCWAASPSEPVEVSVKPLPPAPVIAAEDPFICPGGATELAVRQAEGGTFQWYKGDSKSMEKMPDEITATCRADEVGHYAVAFFGENECWSPLSAAITVGEHPLPKKPEIVPSQAILYASLDYAMTVKTPTEGERYEWYKNSLFTDVTAASFPIRSLDGDDTGSYAVRAVNEHECYVWSDPYPLAWVDAQLFVPNIFTPNGDGVNDCFQIIGLEDFVENKLVIYSKLGQVMYSQKNYHNTWCGLGMPDIYYYVLELTNESGAKSVLHGYVHVKP
jgi:gliding motility-associated-like protein